MVGYANKKEPLRAVDFTTYGHIVSDPQLASSITRIRSIERELNPLRAFVAELTTEGTAAAAAHQAWTESTNRKLALEDEQNKLKKCLPIMSISATFRDGIRKKEGAQRTPFVWLDYDKCGTRQEIDRVYHDIIYPNRHTFGLRMFKVSTREHGFHLAFDAIEGLSIPETVEHVANMLGIEPDMQCTHLAQCPYLSPVDDIYYLSPDMFEPCELPAWLIGWDEEKAVRDWKRRKNHREDAVGRVSVAVSTPVNVDAVSTTVADADAVTEWDGGELRDIAAALLDNGGGVPQEGNRNTRLFAAACQLCRIATEEDAYQALAPHSTLPYEELRRVCANAHKTVAAAADSTLPTSLATAMEQTREQETYVPDTTPNFRFPPIFEEYYKHAPASHKKGMPLVILPALGACGCALCAKYNDDNVEHPRFQVVVVGRPASGKSLFFKASEECLRLMRADDEAGKQLHDDWSKRKKVLESLKKPSKEEQQELRELLENEPIPPQQVIGDTISKSELGNVMTKAGPLDLIQTTTELSSVLESFGEKHTNLQTLLRKGFGAELLERQFFNKTDCFSGSVAVRINYLYLSQPSTCEQVYDKAAEERGTTSRTIFVHLNPPIGAPIPKMTPFTPEERQRIDAALARLYGVSRRGNEAMEPHFVEVEWLNKRIAKWCEKIRKIIIATGDVKLEDAYKRPALIAFRAGILAWFLWGEQDTRTVRENTCRFAEWVADMTLEGQMQHLSDRPAPKKKGVLCGDVYTDLADSFTREELEAALRRRGKASHPAKVVSSWQAVRLIAPKGYGQTTFRKT